MYRYETHLHTCPVSKCANATVRQTLEAYKEMGYDGVFITNHFLDGNINIERTRPYEERIEFYFSDYEQAVQLRKEIGIKVFLGIELSAQTDFLVYGLDKAWFLRHPEVMELQARAKLEFLREHGACLVQAHPFREAAYIDHIKLYPRTADAVEIINAGCSDAENQMAQLYATHYGLLGVAGSDNHSGKRNLRFAGIQTQTPIADEQDYIQRIKSRNVEIFTYQRPSDD